MTRRTLSHLERLGVEYEYIDVEKDSAASQWVKNQNNGKEKKPTIQIGATILCNPHNRELEDALRKRTRRSLTRFTSDWLSRLKRPNVVPGRSVSKTKAHPVVRSAAGRFRNASGLLVRNEEAGMRRRLRAGSS